MPMKIETQKSVNGPILVISSKAGGDCNLLLEDVESLKRAIQSFAQKHDKSVTLDFSKVGRIFSGIATVLGLLVVKDEISLTLLGTSTSVENMLKLARVDRFLKLAASNIESS